MIGPLRVALMAAAGAASLAWFAYRQLAPPRIIRELDLASLERHVANWLPKLHYVPYIRLGMPGIDWLEMRGDGGAVHIALVRRPASGLDAARERTFRQSCEAQAWDVSEHEIGPACTVPTEAEAVTRALETLLRDVFAVTAGSRLVATIPGGG